MFNTCFIALLCYFHVYIFLFHCNKDLFVLWFCTLHVLNYIIYVLVLTSKKRLLDWEGENICPKSILVFECFLKHSYEY
jgi:hypothetical protein